MTMLPLARSPVKKQTISGLIQALQELEKAGYGEFAIVRADSEAGPMSIGTIDLYDWKDAQERGEVDFRYGFLIG